MQTKLLLLLMILSPMAYANDLTDAIQKDTADLNANTATLERASSAGTEASQHYSHLANDVLPLLQGNKARYESDVNAYNIENASVASAISAHNANRCMQEACAAAYNAERDRLNAQAMEMQSQKRLLDQRQQNLITLYNNLATDSQDTFKKIKQARADYDEALAERKTIENHLTLLKAESAGCKLLLKAQGQGTNEALKLRCGNVQFDGADASLPAPPPDPPLA